MEKSIFMFHVLSNNFVFGRELSIVCGRYFSPANTIKECLKLKKKRRAEKKNTLKYQVFILRVGGKLFNFRIERFHTFEQPYDINLSQARTHKTATPKPKRKMQTVSPSRTDNISLNQTKTKQKYKLFTCSFCFGI